MIISGVTVPAIHDLLLRFLMWRAMTKVYFCSFQALKMVLEKEQWMTLPPDTVQVISFAGLVGDGAALIASPDSSNARVLHSHKIENSISSSTKKGGFSDWIRTGNPFSLKITHTSTEGCSPSQLNGAIASDYGGNTNDYLHGDKATPRKSDADRMNGTSVLEDENEDLLADFIDEDSQLPSRISKPNNSRNHSSRWNGDEITAQTGSSLCLLRSEFCDYVLEKKIFID